MKIKSRTHFNQLRNLQPFALLDTKKLDVLIDKLGEKKYAPGEHIIVQGDRGDIYYIIKSGKVVVLKKMLTDEPERVATLEEGQGFGEEALITSSPRNATVQAVDETVVWTLSMCDFICTLKSTFLDEVNPEDVLSKAKEQFNYLDVRMQMEYDEEHIPDAINIPLDELRKRYSELDQSRKYYVYCLVGARSATAAFLMNSQGFNAKSIKGGLLNWPGPVEEGNGNVHTSSAST